MRLPVASHKPGPVNTEHHRQILNAYVVQNLIVGSLQERRVNRHDGFQAAGRQSRRKGHRVLLRDPHVKEPLRVHVAEAFQPHTVRHGRRNRHHLLIPLPQLAHDRGKNVRIIRLRLGGTGNARLDIEGLRAVKSGRMPLRGRISPALLGNDMNQHRLLDFPCLPKDMYHLLNIMAVHRSQIGDTHILKEHPGHNEMLKTAFGAPNLAHHLIPVLWLAAQGVINPLFQIQIHVSRTDIVQILGNAAHIFGNGHIVIV